MKVAEIDNAIRGLLEEEYRRSCDVLAALAEKAAHYPKGGARRAIPPKSPTAT